MGRVNDGLEQAHPKPADIFICSQAQPSDKATPATTAWYPNPHPSHFFWQQQLQRPSASACMCEFFEHTNTISPSRGIAVCMHPTLLRSQHFSHTAHGLHDSFSHSCTLDSHSRQSRILRLSACVPFRWQQTCMTLSELVCHRARLATETTFLCRVHAHTLKEGRNNTHVCSHSTSLKGVCDGLSRVHSRMARELQTRSAVRARCALPVPAPQRPPWGGSGRWRPLQCL